MEVEIGDLVAGGRAFARLPDGTPLFVAGALPGERAEVHIERRRARIAEGRATRILRAASDRVVPACPWFDSCGGCDWMHLDGAAQLRWKGVIARETARRQARVELDQAPTVSPSPDALGYRGRIRVHVDRRGRVGFFAPGTHRIVAVEGCAVAEPAVQDALDALRSMADGVGPEFGRQVSGAELRTGDQETPWAVHLFWRERRAQPTGPLRAALERLSTSGAAVWAAGKVLHGAADTVHPLPGGLHLRAGPLAFLQANPSANHRLVEAVRDIAVEFAGDGGRFVDLFCGAGNFTLPLLAAGLDGIGVELSAGAVGDARRAAEEQSLPPEAFVSGRVDGRLGNKLLGGAVDVLLLDPPRTGARNAIEAIADLGPRALIYISCDPVTLARDVGDLRSRGYEPDRWLGFDLFPQTHHLESVVTLLRSP